MSANPNLFELVTGILAVILPFWPFVVLSGFLTRPRHPLWPMLVAWMVMFVCWFSARIDASPPLLTIIPEPVNTALFFAAGTLIAGLYALRKPLRLNI